MSRDSERIETVIPSAQFNLARSGSYWEQQWQMPIPLNRHQLLHQSLQLRRRRVPRDHFVIADARLAQGFLLHRVAGGGGALVVAGTLEKLRGVDRASVRGDGQQSSGFAGAHAFFGLARNSPAAPLRLPAQRAACAALR